MDKKYNCLELFAGSRSIGKEAEKIGFNVFSSDINNYKNIDYVIDILNFDVNKVPFVPTVIWASCPCTFFSVASIWKHWNIDHTPKTEDAFIGLKIVKATLKIINHFLKLNPDLKFFIENPRGKLRKLKVLENIERTTIWYCQYSKYPFAKPTDIWSNHIYNLFNTDGWKPRKECFNGNINCHHQVAPRGSTNGIQGAKNPYERSKIPKELCQEILKSI